MTRAYHQQLLILASAFLTALLAGGACAHNSEQAAPLPQASFLLSDGNPVSASGYDDYNPIVLQLSNGSLALVFASTRTCSVACTNHNIFIASSVSAYTNNGKLPAFNAPQPVTANASALNFSTRLRLAANASGNNITVFVKDTAGIISTTGAVSPVSAVPINVGASLPAIAAYNCYAGTMLGIDATGLMISTAGASGPISRYDSTSAIPFCPTNTLTNTAMASAVNISIVRASAIGIAEGFLVTDTAGTLRAHTATSAGPVMKNFGETLTQSKLFLTSATAFQASQAAGDLLVFSASAGAGLPSDMYILANRTPSALWLNYTVFGAQPTP